MKVSDYYSRWLFDHLPDGPTQKPMAEHEFMALVRLTSNEVHDEVYDYNPYGPEKEKRHG